jgi:hypothetical protein
VLLCGDWGGHVGAQPRGGDSQRRPGHQTQETGRGPGRLLHASPVDRPADRPQPAFAEFFQQPGRRTPAGRDRLVRAGGPILDRVNRALGYLEELLPFSIDEACFINRSGPEVARVVRGERATRDELSPDESASPFFKPTFALRDGQVYQARPSVSPDTTEWVISSSTLLPTLDRSKQAIVHFEITIESFRRRPRWTASSTSPSWTRPLGRW